MSLESKEPSVPGEKESFQSLGYSMDWNESNSVIKYYLVDNREIEIFFKFFSRFLSSGNNR